MLVPLLQLCSSNSIWDLLVKITICVCFGASEVSLSCYELNALLVLAHLK